MVMFMLNLVDCWASRKALAKIIREALRNKLGCDVDILINSVKITKENSRVHLRADFEADMTEEDGKNIIKKTVGLK